MKSKSAILIFATFVSLNLAAMNITTTDNKTYKNVTVLDTTPISLGISYKTAKGAVVKDIMLAKLPKALQKKYHYTPKKAAAFKQTVKLYKKKQLAEAYKLALKNAKLQKNIDKVTARINHIKAMLYAHRMTNIQLIVISVEQGGVVATCSPATPGDHSLTTGNFGKFFIVGTDLTSGSQWWGNLYPVNQTKSLETGLFPVYTTSLTKATEIVLSNQKQ